ncbi:MAG: UPF0280 family protein [Desulfurobacteriaceae bacterium]
MKIVPEKRSYRRFQKPDGFTSFEVIVGESDLWISVPESRFCDEIVRKVKEKVVSIRAVLKEFIDKHPAFYASLKPVSVPPLAPAVVLKMARAAELSGVGPMAGVAGAFNYFVGKELESFGLSEFIIENGGDLYISSRREVTVALITGDLRVDGKIGLKLPPGKWGVCTSSSKIGHSLSLGRTRSATAIAEDPVIADCVATYLGNSVSLEEAKRRVEEVSKLLWGGIVYIEGSFVLSGNVEVVKVSFP